VIKENDLNDILKNEIQRFFEDHSHAEQYPMQLDAIISQMPDLDEKAKSNLYKQL
jgi:hypothetical protein